MEPNKPDLSTGPPPTVTTAATTTSGRLASTVIRPENPIREMPELVPVSNPKPPVDSQQQSVLKKSVTAATAAGGQQNLIKIVQRSLPIKTIQGPNGNLIVHRPNNKIVSLQIKGGSMQTTPQPGPLSLVPITLPKEAKAAMLKLSGLTAIQPRKIAPKETITQTIPPAKLNSPKDLIPILKPVKDLKELKELTLTKKPAPKQQPISIVKLSSQDTPSTSKPASIDTTAVAKLSTKMTTSIPTTTSQVLSSLVSSKALEIKPITVTDSPKPLTPAQAATVPNTQITATNLLPKLCATQADNFEIDSITIESKTLQKLQPIRPKKDVPPVSPVSTLQTVSNKMISLQISNGKLSDPNGPIKLISANNNIPREHHEKSQKPSPAEREKTPDLPTFVKDAPENIEDKVPASQSSDDLVKPTSTPERATTDTEPVLPAKSNKQKQQSLLRSKTIEILQRSPRTKFRSKSLTALQKKLNNMKRRISAASDSEIRKPARKLPSISPPATKSSPENQVNKLLCPEKISTSSSSLGSSSSVEEKVTALPIKYVAAEVIEMDSSDDDSKSKDEEESAPNLATPKMLENEIYNCLNWNHGVGCLRESSLQFQFNEFGLIEIIDSVQIKSEFDYHYERPIFEREFKSQKTLDYSNPYFCKGCNCKGAAVDFLTPEFCSRECIRRYNRHIGSGMIMKAPKKYTNRKKCILPSNEMKDDPLEIKSEVKTASKSARLFSWDTYLNICKGEPTPIDLFLNPFPCSSNMFSVGMKLEAIDPEHSSMFCVCTIVEKKGYRLKLRFDGYPKFYDFWVNADSMDIFPPGWCAKTNRTLQPPRGISPLSFNWPKYLNQTKSLPAPRNLFTHLNSSSQTHGFKIGMKIEADDLRNSGKVCVATIADILDNRLLILFDGWDDSYSYWIDINSPYIHPVNWHRKNGFSIVPPPEYEHRFSWETYISYTDSVSATEDMFRTRDPIDFKPGMKLEVVDKRNPSLIRPASVIMTDDYEIKVLFEGWPMNYAFWIEDDSPDIHPIGWCEITNHELESPPGFESLPSRYDCKFPGCRGIGNALHELDVHTNIMSCPYEPSNWAKEIDKSGRLKSLKNITRYDSTSILDLKSKGMLHRNKRKAEILIKEPIPYKVPKQQLQSSSLLVSKPSGQIPPSTGTSLLANKIEKPETNDDVRINIARHLLCDYGPRLQQVYSLWKQNSECLAVNLSENKDHSTNPLEWTANEVACYISKIPRCLLIAQEFIKQDIDGSAFLAMRQTDLTEIMKIKLGPSIKIYNQIIQLREDVVTRFLSNSLKPAST